MTIPSCCEHHGIDCRQGRDFPERGYLPREQADKPAYTVDEMSGAVRWSIVVLCLLAFVCAASPAFWYSFY
jgi:hypothetical protein